MKNTSFGKRVLALALVLMMCVGMLPNTAFAASCDHVYAETCGRTSGVSCETGHTHVLTCTKCGHKEYKLAVTDRHIAGSATNLSGAFADNTHSATCSVCGYLYNEAHSWVAATCTSTRYCSLCGASEKNGQVDTNNHSWDNGTVTTQATCTTEGVKTFTCTNGCGATKTESIAIDESNHDAACTGQYVDIGAQHKAVRVCGAEGESADHCYNDGENECYVCGHVKSGTTDPVDPTDPTDPTDECDHESGYDWKYDENDHWLICDKCTERYFEGEHKFYAENGTKCSTCGYVKGSDTHKHNFLYAKTTSATCTTDGLDYYDCSCGEIMTEVNEKALGHDFSKHIATASHDSSCTKEGVDVWKCSRCDATENRAIPKKGHTYVTVDEVPFTCETGGVKKHMECKTCGQLAIGTNEVTEADVKIPAGHELVRVEQTDATCAAAGTLSHEKCENCGKLFKGTKGEVTADELVIPATDKHSWSDWAVMDDEHDGECRECSVCLKHETRDASTDPTDSPSTEPSESTDPTDSPSTEPSSNPNPSESTDPNPNPTNPGGEVDIPDNDVPMGGGDDIFGGDITGGEVELDDGDVPLAGPVTRAEFVDYLYRDAGSPDTGLSTFEDVPADHEYALAVGWGQANNIAWGVSATEFLPDELVTVEQVKLFLSRYSAFKGIEMPELAALVGLDDKAIATNCDEILGEFFGADE